MNRAGPVPPSVTSAWSVPWSCTTKRVFLTFGQISARRAEKSFPAISITCSGNADVSALTSNLSDLGLESDIARLVLSLLSLPDGALLHRCVLAGGMDRMRRLSAGNRVRGRDDRDGLDAVHGVARHLNVHVARAARHRAVRRDGHARDGRDDELHDPAAGGRPARERRRGTA